MHDRAQLTADGRHRPRVFTAKTVAQALTEFQPRRRTSGERVVLERAGGRVPIEAIRADAPLPGFHRSSVDGFAVRAQDTFGASEAIPAYLEVSGSVMMGAAAGSRVEPRRAIAVPTGGALPDGADAVVMIEHTQTAMPGAIEVLRPSVRRAPVVAILPTGDEVRPLGSSLAPGELLDTNSLMLAGQARELRCEAIVLPTEPDDQTRIADAIRSAVTRCDLLIVIAGSSAGRDDYIAQLVDELGELAVHGVAVRPGHPVVLGAAVEALGGYDTSEMGRRIQ